MSSPGINGEGELMGQLANPGSRGKMAVKTECVCVCSIATMVVSRTVSEINGDFSRMAVFKGVSGIKPPPPPENF